MPRYTIMTPILPLVISLVALTIFLVVTKARQRKGSAYLVKAYVLMFYLVILLVEVVGFPNISEWLWSSQLGVPLFRPLFHMVPFSEGLMLTDQLNLILFIPLGFLLPSMWSTFRSGGKTLLYGMVFSLAIEGGQMFSSARITDVNDLIMNTLGVAVGWLIWRLVFGRRKMPHFEEQDTVVDWLIFPLVALVASICS